jgi:hypothetical protein
MTFAQRAASLVVFVSCIALLSAIPVATLPGAPAEAQAAVGGIASRSSEPPAEAGVDPEAPATMAKLVDGRAIPPVDAPRAVKKVIHAANKIRRKPYVWGGGHGRWWDRGYDCSGAVSFALRGGKLIDSALPSGAMTRWGESGLGRWITVFANGGHAYAVIAGLRWDTSGTGGNGPRWHEDMRNAKRFTARHPASY